MSDRQGCAVCGRRTDVGRFRYRLREGGYMHFLCYWRTGALFRPRAR